MATHAWRPFISDVPQRASRFPSFRRNHHPARPRYPLLRASKTNEPPLTRTLALHSRTRAQHIHTPRSLPLEHFR
ncbi:hypothetical protein C2E23DRAFT_826849 [Lenzites betulinus]|nr:hypothetical protein C2E23DRAFT_826849 [Lenzites betulinus]